MKAHLIESDAPLVSGKDLTALCGAVVKNAKTEGM